MQMNYLKIIQCDFLHFFTDLYMLCKEENLQNRQCIKYLFSPLLTPWTQLSPDPNQLNSGHLFTHLYVIYTHYLVQFFAPHHCEALFVLRHFCSSALPSVIFITTAYGNHTLGLEHSAPTYWSLHSKWQNIWINFFLTWLMIYIPYMSTTG